MLKLRRHMFSPNSSLDFPHSVRGSVQHKFAFAPILTEEDELIAEIDNNHSDTWELIDQSEGELEAFWDHVVEDVRHDPDWNFASDD